MDSDGTQILSKFKVISLQYTELNFLTLLEQNNTCLTADCVKVSSGNLIGFNLITTCNLLMTSAMLLNHSATLTKMVEQRLYMYTTCNLLMTSEMF